VSFTPRWPVSTTLMPQPATLTTKDGDEMTRRPDKDLAAWEVGLRRARIARAAKNIVRESHYRFSLGLTNRGAGVRARPVT
jgi:hypothetical protein